MRTAATFSWVQALTILPKSVNRSARLKPAKTENTAPSRSALNPSTWVPARETVWAARGRAKTPCGLNLATRSSTIREKPRVINRQDDKSSRVSAGFRARSGRGKGRSGPVPGRGRTSRR